VRGRASRFPIVKLLQQKRVWLAALLAAIALSFFINMAFVVISRTATRDRTDHAGGLRAAAFEMAQRPDHLRGSRGPSPR